MHSFFKNKDCFFKKKKKGIMNRYIIAKYLTSPVIHAALASLKF